MNKTTSIFVLASALLAAAPALAASDYLLELDGVKGEAVAPVQVESWSFGVCNAGQCSTVSSPRDAATGQSTGKRQYKPSVKVQASQNTQSLRESPTRASVDGSSGAVTAQECKKPSYSAAHFDLDCDGRADLAFAGTQDEVSSLSFTFQKITVEWRGVCTGKHIDKAVLRSPGTGDEFVITDATVSCSGPRQSTGRAAATCAAGACDLAGPVTMTFTGGQMKHVRTGHVTLLK
ncbi:MAG: hypothetical protein ABL914_12450 [Novosphingobium sp.]|uniref:hypothetical protein n=1 Tax=Novosphingobium sp. TaxID=1874826 RepID=UPI0032BD699C